MAGGTAAELGRGSALRGRAAGWPSPSRTGGRAGATRRCGSRPAVDEQTARAAGATPAGRGGAGACGRTATSGRAPSSGSGALVLRTRPTAAPDPRAGGGRRPRGAAGRGARAAAVDGRRDRLAGPAGGLPQRAGRPVAGRVRRRAARGARRVGGAVPRRPAAARRRRRCCAAWCPGRSRGGWTRRRRSGWRCRAARGSGSTTATRRHRRCRCACRRCSAGGRPRASRVARCGCTCCRPPRGSSRSPATSRRSGPPATRGCGRTCAAATRGTPGRRTRRRPSRCAVPHPAAEAGQHGAPALARRTGAPGRAGATCRQPSRQQCRRRRRRCRGCWAGRARCSGTARSASAAPRAASCWRGCRR